MVMRSNDSRVCVLHMPTGISATCESERGQFRNRQKAMTLLRARLYAVRNVPRNDAVVRTYRANE